MNGRRVFTEVSAALLKARPHGFGDRGKDELRGWTDAMLAVADVFESMNSAFDRARFIRDCETAVSVQNYDYAELGKLVIRHAEKFGRLKTEALLREAGAPYYSVCLAKVPPANCPALGVTLRKNLEGA